MGSFYRSQVITCNVLKVAVWFLGVEVYSHHTTAQKLWHKWSDEVRLCDWGLFATEDATSNTKFKFRHISPNRQDAIALDYCAMHVWFNKLKSSDFFYISMWTTHQLRPNKKYLTKSAQLLYYSILVHFNALVRTHLELVLCNSYVISEIEVNRPLLYIHVDDISNPTSGMPSLARMTLRYSFTANSINASWEHI